MAKLSPEDEQKWLDLKQKALASMDERTALGYEGCVRHSKKMLGKMGLEHPPVDPEKVVSFLLNYSNQMKYTLAATMAGISLPDLVTAFRLWPEAKVVRDYIRSVNLEIREIDNEEMLDEARQGLHRLLTVEDCGLNARAVTFANERLDKRTFGDPRVQVAEDEREAAQGGTGGGITINIIADAAKVAEKPPEKPTGKAAVFIDV